MIVERADADKLNMALTSWKGSIVRKQDIFIAKNYLTENEIDTLNRLATILLETAELRAKERKDITIDFWRNNVDRVLEYHDKKILDHKGSVSNALMEEKLRWVYTEFNKKRKVIESQNEDLKKLEEIERLIKNKEKIIDNE